MSLPGDDFCAVYHKPTTQPQLILKRRTPTDDYVVLARAWQASAANPSPVVKFPDDRENTGNIAEIGPSSHAEPLKNQPIWDEIPY